MSPPTLAVVTASLFSDQPEMLDCRLSWRRRAANVHAYYTVTQAAPHAQDWWQKTRYRIAGQSEGWYYTTTEILGVVPAFALGVQKALEDGAEIIACFHDDLLIEQDGWDQQVLGLFQKEPTAGLCGFGGALGLGDDDLYQTPYNPMQLARKDFLSNMRDAEAHGRRVTEAERVSCLDGFSQIGRAAFWEGITRRAITSGTGHQMFLNDAPTNLFAVMQSWGVVHHFYDGMLGCFAKRHGWEVWMLPVACHHYGGQTAVGDPRYKVWADTTAQAQHQAALSETYGGDQLFWEQAHKIGYEQFKDVLPLRLP